MSHIRKKSGLLSIASIFGVLVMLLSACGTNATTDGG